MRIFDKFRRSKEMDQGGSAATTSPSCPHTAMVARWDNAADIGRDDLAASWLCTSCGLSFSPDEYRALRESEAARLKESLMA